MRKFQKRISGFDVTQKYNLFIVIMIICFLLGITCGCVFCFQSKSSNLSSSVTEILDGIMLNGSVEYSFIKTYFNYIKYIFLVFLLGFTVLGLIGIPATVFFKGFFLSLSISSILRSYGQSAIFIALSMFGIQSLLSLPCILITSAIAFGVSLELTKAVTVQKQMKSRFSIKTSQYIFVLLSFVVLALVFTFLDVALTPKLVSISSKTLLS